MARARTCLFTVAVMAILSMGYSGANASTITTTQAFTFTGTCSDCTGFGVGHLVLQNYTEGTNATPSNFVSFNYSSNLVNYTITSADLNSFSADIGPTLPGREPVTITADSFETQFISRSGGSWCTGTTGNCLADIGPDHSWSVTTAAVPEPASVALLAVGLVGLARLRRRRV